MLGCKYFGLELEDFCGSSLNARAELHLWDGEQHSIGLKMRSYDIGYESVEKVKQKLSHHSSRAVRGCEQ